MSWITRLLGRSEPTPALASIKGELEDSGAVDPILPLEGIKGEPGDARAAFTKLADIKGDVEPSRAAFDAFLELDGIKGETEDRASAIPHGDPDQPVVPGQVPSPAPPGGVPIPYPLASEAAGEPEAGQIGGMESLTVGGAETETAMPGLHKSSDVTLKRGVIGDEGGDSLPLKLAGDDQEYLRVKLENVQITSYQLGGSSGAEGDTFGFGVEREFKESGEKGGTEDINIGVSELQETTISKSADTSAPGSANPFDVKIEEVVAPRFESGAGGKATLDIGLARDSSDPEEGGEVSLRGIKIARESSDPEEGGEVSGAFIGRNDGTIQPSAEEEIFQHEQTDLEFLARKAGGGQEEYLKVKFEDIIVTGVSPGGTDADQAQGASSHELGHTIGLRHEHVRPESSEEPADDVGALEPEATADVQPFGGFQGGVRVAVGDVNSDGSDAEMTSTLADLEPEAAADVAGNFRETAEGQMGDLDADDLDLDLDDDKDVEV